MNIEASDGISNESYIVPIQNVGVGSPREFIMYKRKAHKYYG